MPRLYSGQQIREDEALFSGFIISVLIFVSGMYVIICWIVDPVFAVNWMHAMNVVLIPALYLFGRWHPAFFAELEIVPLSESEVEERRSYLNGVNLENVESRLEHLMEEQKPFLEMGVKLEELAQELGLTKHQFSEYLNDTSKRISQTLFKITGLRKPNDY